MYNFLLLALLFVLSACSSLSKPTLAVSAPPIFHETIDMSGRLSAQYQHNNKPQAIHINFNWSQTPQQTEVTLTSPTGQTLATLLVNPQGVQLNRPNQPPQFANDANQLMLTMLGWPLPVTGLRDWLQGFMDPSHRMAITSAHSDSYFIIDGWMISYITWAAEHHTERPKRIDLKRQTDEAGLVTLRIVIDEWNGQ